MKTQLSLMPRMETGGECEERSPIHRCRSFWEDEAYRWRTLALVELGLLMIGVVVMVFNLLAGAS